jgi:hypothetical protein
VLDTLGTPLKGQQFYLRAERPVKVRERERFTTSFLFFLKLLLGSWLLAGLLVIDCNSVLTTQPLNPIALFFGSFCAVLGTTLAAIFYASRIKGSTDDMVTNTGKVFYTTTTDEHNGVFLEVVANTGDVSGYFKS